MTDIIKLISEELNRLTPVVLNENHIYEAEDDTEDQEEPEQVTQAANNFEQMANAVKPEGDVEAIGMPNESQIGGFTVYIPVSREYSLNKVIASMIKAATKLGVTPPVITKGNKTTKVVTVDGYKYAVDVIPVSVNVDQVFRMPGNYKLEAVVDTRSGGSVAVGTDPIPHELLNGSQDCDYCHQKRDRIKSFIVRGGADNGYKTLGSNCVNKFLGINPAKYLRMLDVYSLFKNTMEQFEEDGFGNEGGGGGFGISAKLRIFDLPKAITIVHNVLKADGGNIKRDWVYPDNGRKYQTNEGEATADKAEEIMDDPDQRDNIKVDEDYVKGFIDFLKNFEIPKDAKYEFQEYLHKMKEIPNKDFRYVDTAFLASAENYFDQNQARLAAPESNFVGEEGAKVKIKDATVTGVRSGDGAYGTWYLWTFVDPAGNVLKKFGELNTKFRTFEDPRHDALLGDINKGDKFSFTTDIKKHEVFNNQKSTQLGRLSKF
jgi:hypothetical protein